MKAQFLKDALAVIPNDAELMIVTDDSKHFHSIVSVEVNQQINVECADYNEDDDSYTQRKKAKITKNDPIYKICVE